MRHLPSLAAVCSLACAAAAADTDVDRAPTSCVEACSVQNLSASASVFNPGAFIRDTGSARIISLMGKSRF